MWVAAFVALGTVWKGAAVLSLVKPSLAPFALVGFGTPSWLLVLAGYAAVSLVMIPLWFQYLIVLRNGTELDWSYSLRHIPLMAVPVIAWITRERPSFQVSSDRDVRPGVTGSRSLGRPVPDSSATWQSRTLGWPGGSRRDRDTSQGWRGTPRNG